MKKPFDVWAQFHASERARRSLVEEVGDLKHLIRLSARIDDAVWIDQDRNLWFSHNCLGVKTESQLDGWKMDRTGKVSPSVKCERCGAHFTLELEMRLRYMEYAPIKWGSTPTTRGRGNGSTNRHAQSQRSDWDGDVPVERHQGGS